MRYFIIAGEASGDIHGAHLINALREHDPEAQFSLLGGDLMAQAADSEPIVHYRDMAFMGFIEVAKHLTRILAIMKQVKNMLIASRHDALILIDYPSFNLKIAKFAHRHDIPVFYFISPKVWAWKEYRVKSIKRYVDHLFCILPFEPQFYRRHNYEVEYVGNPTVGEIEEASKHFQSREQFLADNGLEADKPIIAIAPGSRRKEIRQNLPVMLEAALRHQDHQLVITGAPSINEELYKQIMEACKAAEMPNIIYGKTFEIMHHARAAIVTSGTATLETALLRTPQVACFRMNGKQWLYRFYSKLIKGRFVTLPNLIADRQVIPELLIHQCTSDNIDSRLTPLLAESETRTKMLSDYRDIAEILTDKNCTETTAQRILENLK